MQVNEVVSQRVKQLRAQHQWSLTQAAQETGVSKAMLGQIERGESNPTIATLWKISQGFGLPLSCLLQTETVVEQPVIQDSGISFNALFAYDAKVGTEMFALTVAPGKEHFSKAHAPGVIEDVIVIEGQLEMTVAGVSRRLVQGDVMRFEADKAHSYRNMGCSDVKFHNVMHYLV